MTKLICTVQLNGLTHDGRALGRIEALTADVLDSERNVQLKEGQVVFVDNAIPGQTVRALITKNKKSYAEATCIEVLEESPTSRPAPCEHAASCGGCPLQSMPYDTQLYWKERMVRDALQRIAKISEAEALNIQSIIPSPQQWEYRNKMEFAFGTAQAPDAQGNTLLLGLRAKASHTIVSVPFCQLMPQNCLRILEELRKLCQAAGLQAWNQDANPSSVLRHAIIRTAHADKRVLLVLITAKTNKDIRNKIARVGRQLMDENKEISGFVHDETGSRLLFAQGEKNITKLGQSSLCQRLGHMEYSYEHNNFFQINSQATANLIQLLEGSAAKLIESAKQQSPCLWDLYCGVGAPGLNLAQYFSDLYGVEINKDAINIAQRNAQDMDMQHCHYVAGDAKQVLRNWPRPYLVLADPPRAGLHPDIVKTILQAQPKYIIYVSCNPASFARDLALFSGDYFLKELTPFDFFPQTAHVETCALLETKAGL